VGEIVSRKEVEMEEEGLIDHYRSLYWSSIAGQSQSPSLRKKA